MTALEHIRATPQRFNPEAMPAGYETCFHFRISGDKGGELTVNVKDGQCNVQDGLQGNPKCVCQASDDTYMDIINGKQNAQMAVFTGKFKISDLAEMMKYHKLFGII